MAWEKNIPMNQRELMRFEKQAKKMAKDYEERIKEVLIAEEGTWQILTKSCESCSKEIDLKQTFCPHCGHEHDMTVYEVHHKAIDKWNDFESNKKPEDYYRWPSYIRSLKMFPIWGLAGLPTFFVVFLGLAGIYTDYFMQENHLILLFCFTVIGAMAGGAFAGIHGMDLCRQIELFHIKHGSPVRSGNKEWLKKIQDSRC